MQIHPRKELRQVRRAIKHQIRQERREIREAQQMGRLLERAAALPPMRYELPNWCQNGNSMQVRGGSGDDSLDVRGTAENDHIHVDAGSGSNRIAYAVSGGRDVVNIEGGSAQVAIAAGDRESVTVLDAEGHVVFQRGRGGTTVRVQDPLSPVFVMDGSGAVVATANALPTES